MGIKGGKNVMGKSVGYQFLGMFPGANTKRKITYILRNALAGDLMGNRTRSSIFGSGTQILKAQVSREYSKSLSQSDCRNMM